MPPEQPPGAAVPEGVAEPGHDGWPGRGGAVHEAIVPTGEDLAFAGVDRLSGLLRAGEVTPRELVELYLARIERLDPRLGAFVSVRPQAALAEADAALERLRTGEPGPLLGVPVAVKDNVDIAGEVTGHGTAAN